MSDFRCLVEVTSELKKNGKKTRKGSTTTEKVVNRQKNMWKLWFDSCSARWMRG